MKFILSILLFFAAGQALAQNKKETIVIKTQVFCDHCKICESCGGRMETDLYYVKGIKQVDYNEADMTISVTYKPKKITPDEIRQEIAKLGFSADHVPADPLAYEKLDGCCKKK